MPIQTALKASVDVKNTLPIKIEQGELNIPLNSIRLATAETAQPARHLRCGVAISGDEGRQWLGMGQVQPAFAGQQELAPDRGCGVVQRHLQSVCHQSAGSDQSSRAAADNRNGWPVLAQKGVFLFRFVD